LQAPYARHSYLTDRGAGRALPAASGRPAGAGSMAPPSSRDTRVPSFTRSVACPIVGTSRGSGLPSRPMPRSLPASSVMHRSSTVRSSPCHRSIRARSPPVRLRTWRRPTSCGRSVSVVIYLRPYASSLFRHHSAQKEGKSCRALWHKRSALMDAPDSRSVEARDCPQLGCIADARPVGFASHCLHRLRSRRHDRWSMRRVGSRAASGQSRGRTYRIAHHPSAIARSLADGCAVLLSAERRV
jgi:hypothetical protein